MSHVQPHRHLLLATVIACLPLVGAAAAQAASVCKVTDPTGTPLNVRDAPNGQKINALKNGREVVIINTGTDAKGRAWARIAGDYEGKQRVWGWVLREFISCYDR